MASLQPECWRQPADAPGCTESNILGRARFREACRFPPRDRNPLVAHLEAEPSLPNPRTNRQEDRDSRRVPREQAAPCVPSARLDRGPGLSSCLQAPSPLSLTPQRPWSTSDAKPATSSARSTHSPEPPQGRSAKTRTRRGAWLAEDESSVRTPLFGWSTPSAYPPPQQEWPERHTPGQDQ